MESIKKIIFGFLKIIVVPAVIFLLLKIFFPQNINFNTFFNIMYQAIAPAVLAWGMLYNIKADNWDFSVGATALVAGIFGGQIAMKLNLGFFGVVAFCVLFGVLCGAINGILYKVLKIPTIIITVGMCLILECVSSLVFGGGGVMVTQEMIVLNSLTPQLLFGVAAFVVTFILYNYLPVGYHVRAIGSSTTIASSKGIDVVKTKIVALIIAGLFAGLYAAVTLGTTGVYRPAKNQLGTMNVCFDAMMCVFVGMCLERLTNLVIAVYIGSVVLKYVKLTLMLAGTESSYEQIFIAVFVLVVLCYSTWKDNRQAETIYKHRSLANVKV